jgi:hypothetical protein
MGTVTTIASDEHRTAQEKTAAVRTALGDSMKCDPEVANETKLVAGGDGVHGTRVDQVDQLHHYNRGETDECDLISLLLAYFNLPYTIEEQWQPSILMDIVNNNSLYTILNIMLNEFKTDPDQTLYRYGIYFRLGFRGVSFIGFQRSTISYLSITPKINLGKKEKQTIVDCLTDIRTAVDQVNVSNIEADTLLAVERDNDFIDNHSHSLRKIFKRIFIEHLHITLFVIAVAALLAGSAVALTTYFHVGTTLMLAAAFIPFLNFVGGFQISLLLGVVTVATAGAGGIYAIVKKKPECCELECRDKEKCYEYNALEY